MDLVDETPATTDPIGREMTRVEQIISRVKYWLTRQRRRFPYFVWYNDEMDVTVTFSEHGLREGADITESMQYLYRSRLAEVERALGDIGVGFDRGGGFDGRDWEWDWSLKGPISIRFRGRARNPHLRMARPKPRLIVSN